MKKKLKILNSALDGVAEISIFGDIDTYDGNYFAELISSYSGEKLRITINSYGGNVTGAFNVISAMTMYMANGGIIETVNAGRADSCAGWIFAAGSRGYRKVLQFAAMFFHAPLFEDGTKIEDLPEGSEERNILEDCLDKIAGIFVSTTGRSEDEIKALMNSETELNADQAITEGFADEKLLVDNVPVIKNSVTSKEFCNIVNSLEYKIINKPTGPIKRKNMKGICKVLNLNSEASEGAVQSEIESVLNARKDAEAQNKVLTQKLAVANTAKEAAEDKLEKLEGAEVLNYVDAVIKADPTKEAQRSFLTNMAKNDFEGFKAVMPVVENKAGGVDINKVINQSANGGGDPNPEKKFEEYTPSERETMRVSNHAKYSELLTAYEKGE